MSNSTTLLDTISSTQSNKEVVVNGNFDAGSPAMLFGRRASTTANLTWGYFGGAFNGVQVANGTVTLTASATNYVSASVTSGAVSVSTTAPGSSSLLLYTIVTGATTVTSYTDNRQSIGGGGGGALAGLADVSESAPATGQQLTYEAGTGKWYNAPQPDQGGFVDGNLDFWSFGTSFTLPTATDTYTSDMWVCNTGTGGAATVSQNVAAVGSEVASMARPRKYRLSFNQTTGSTGNPLFGQKIEGVGQYSGQIVTVSAFIAAASALTAGIVGIRVVQNFGTGGSPSTTVVTTQAVSWNIGTTDTRFSVNVAIPSVAGKTLGTNGNDFLRIDFSMASGATFTMYFSQPQIDLSTSGAPGAGIALPFRYRGVAVEAVRVRRYVRAVDGFIGFCTTYNATTAYGGFSFERMRSAPAYTLLTALSNFNFFSPAAGNVTPTAITVGANSASSGTLNVSITGGTAGQAGYLTANVSPAILADARF